MRTHPAVLLMLLFLGCREPEVTSSAGGVWASPETIEFGRTFIGFPKTQALTLHNDARAPRQVSLTVSGDFHLSSPEHVELAAAAEVELSVRFDPPGTGAHAGLLRVEVEGEAFELQLLGNAEVAPECIAMGPCIPSTFDPDVGECVLAPSPDQTPCMPDNACLTNGVCVGGACVGSDTACDDDNACTQDACDPVSGCVFLDVTEQCPAPTDPCQATACDPEIGCTAVPAIDGTACGPSDCTTAHVCLAGVCKMLAVPEGSACGPRTPCQDRGTCIGGTCQRPAPGLTPIAWRYTPTDPLPADVRIAADAADNLYWTECNDLECTGPGCGCALVSLTSSGALRYRAWMGLSSPPRLQLIVGDRIVSLFDDQGLLAQRTSDGAVQWMLSTSSLPFASSGGGSREPWVTLHDFAAANGQLFLAYTEDTGSQSFIWVVGIDPGTGAVRWSYNLPGTTLHLLADRFGNTHARGLVFDPVAQTHASRIYSLSPAGTLRWSDDQYTPALATAGQQLFTWTIAGLDANSGATVWDHPAAHLIGSIDGLIGPLARGPWNWWVLPNLGTGAVLVKLANADGSTQWQVPLTTWGHDSIVQPILTERDEVLISAREPGGPWNLLAIDADGETGYRCELPAPGAVWRSPVLVRDTLVMVKWETGEEIVGFHIPATRAAPTGWSGFRGNPQRTNSDR